MDYETILTDVGGLGRYQILIFNILAMTSLKASFDIELMVFQTYKWPFRCQNNSTLNQEYSLKPTSRNCLQNVTTLVNGTIQMHKEKCSKFEYKKIHMQSNLVTEYDLVCNEDWWRDAFVSAYFMGAAVGMLFGTLGDRIGRKKIILICGVMDIIVSPIPAFMPDPVSQFISRFIKGFPSAVYYQGLLLLEEVTAEKYRSLVGNNYWIWWCFGYAGSSLVAYLIPDWQTLQLISLVPCTVYIFIFIFASESPRWLVLKGRQKEACAVFRRMARINKKKLPNDYFKEIRIKEEPTGRLQEAFIYPNMRKKNLIIWYLLFVFAFTYFGLSLDGSFASDNVYISVLLNGLVEIPSSLIAWKLSDIFGRRRPVFLMEVLAGVCVIVVPFMPKGSIAWLRTCVAILGKLFLTSAYCITDVYATELFPTSIRSIGLFCAACLSMIGNVLAPVANSSAKILFFLPNLIYAVFTVSAGCVILVLPETKGCPLAETVEESEYLVRGKEEEFKKRMQVYNENDEEVPLGEFFDNINDKNVQI